MSSSFKSIVCPLAIAFALSVNVQASQLQITSNHSFPETVQTTNLSNDSVYVTADKMPQFTGGDKALFAFMNENIVYPADAYKRKEQGKVIVQFVVSKTGKVTNAKVLKGVSADLDAEALRVIAMLPDWTPGELNGDKVDVYQTIPVMFKWVDPNDESAWQVNDKTVIVIDDVKMPESFNIGILNQSKLTAATILKPFPKEERSRLIDLYGKQAANGVIKITTNKEEMYYALADTADAKIDCKEEALLPEFNGGKQNLFKYLNDSIQYPFVAKQLKTQGKVIVRFLVGKTGKISDAMVMQSVDYYLNKEALRVISTMPDWTPAARCGHKMAIYVTMPVSFKLELSAAEKGWEKNDKTIILLNGVRLPSTFDLSLLNYAALASYKVLQPGDKATNKKLTSQYGKDAVNGVVLIDTTAKEEEKK